MTYNHCGTERTRDKKGIEKEEGRTITERTSPRKQKMVKEFCLNLNDS
jgi:hypothetical protein